MNIKIIANEKGHPPGKLADVELHFGLDRFGPKDGEPLEGLKLVGFSVWERHNRQRAVTFPARVYSVNGERRSFALLRPVGDNGIATEAQNRVRDLILTAYAEHEAYAGTEPTQAADLGL